MKRNYLIIFLILLLSQACMQKRIAPSQELISDINLKHGEIISCGPPDQKFGDLMFAIPGNEILQNNFNFAVKLLHSFEYDEAEKAFAKVIETDPNCAMAYWGVAMCNFHLLWTPPTELELKKGAKAIQIAKSIKNSRREDAYIDAIAAFYKDWQTTDHHSRCLNYEKGMEKVYLNYKDDHEAAIFYALSLDAAADPTDKSFSKQKKAGSILNALYPGEPNHPGIAHYLIHTYDYPELAKLGLEAARKYASVAPSSAHALHMPSHIFTRLGLWDECIKSNIASVESAKCYAASADLKGHWDEELHGLDYLTYSYLQKGENDSAKKQWDYLKTINDVEPINFKVAYAYAAIPSRYVLENKLWEEASKLEFLPLNFQWQKYPWQQAILRFARLMGFVHLKKTDSAKKELAFMKVLYDTLSHQKDVYKANQIAIQMKTGSAWIDLAQRKTESAIELMTVAVAMEDKTEKHPVTPGEVLPAKELLGDMYLDVSKPYEALIAYEGSLEKRPNRFNTLWGAGIAAYKSGDKQKAKLYFEQLKSLAGTNNFSRPELIRAAVFLKE